MYRTTTDSFNDDDDNDEKDEGMEGIAVPRTSSGWIPTLEISV
jgi:hypothetical protein